MAVPELQNKTPGTSMTHYYRVAGMTCKSCAAKIETALRAVKEVSDVKVTLAPPEATLEMRSHVPLARLNEALTTAGHYKLAEKAFATSEKPEAGDFSVKAYFPLILIGLYLIGGVMAREISLARFDLHTMMTNFMGGFFVVFSFFKLLDLKGFAEGYRTYDLIAARFQSYGYVYPFLELGLGLLYLSGFAPITTNLLTVLVMGVSSIGVIKTLRENRTFQCACLGTIFKLPLTKITLAEDLLMFGMALAMLILLVFY